MKVQMKANHRSVSRLSRYRSVLCRFKSYNVKWVFSEQIASALGITAAQVRKDFSHFGVTGKRKIGYSVDPIIEHLNKILRKDERNTAIIAGFGPLGKAVYKEYFLGSKGLEILAAFDTKQGMEPEYDEETGLTVFRFDDLIKYAADNDIRFGVIAIANKTAQTALDLMVLAGIRGILALSPIDLKSPKTCFVNAINVVREFENVVFFAGAHGRGKRSAGDA